MPSPSSLPKPLTSPPPPPTHSARRRIASTTPLRSSSDASAPPLPEAPSTTRHATTPTTSRASPMPLATSARAFSSPMASELGLGFFFARLSSLADSPTLPCSILSNLFQKII